MKKIIITILVLAIAAAAALFLKSQKKAVEELPVARTPIYNVDTAESSTKSVRETRHFLAQLLASKSAMIASKFSSEIKKVYVKENDVVKKGDLLITLDDTDIRTNIASLKKQKQSLEIDVANAKRSLDRNKKLLEIEAISQEKYDNANVMYQNKLSALDATKQKIKQAQGQLAYLNIRAPFSGRVGTIFVDAGNLAVPGKPIISLNSDDQKLIFSYVATSQPIIEGQKVLIDNQLVGTIARRYDDAKNALLVAEVKLNMPLHYANKAFLNIDVVIAETTGCSVPLNALLHRKDDTVVMLYKEGSFVPFEADIILQDERDAILTECPTFPVATASEAKLALLPTLGKVNVSGDE